MPRFPLTDPKTVPPHEVPENLARISQLQSILEKTTITTENLQTSPKPEKQQNTTLTGIGNQQNETIKSKVDHFVRQPFNQEITLEDWQERPLPAPETPRQDEKPVAVGTQRRDHSVPTSEEKLLKLLKETDKLLGDLDSNSDNDITSEEENARESFYKKDDEEEENNNLDLRTTNAAAVAAEEEAAEEEAEEEEEEEEKAEILQPPRRSEKTITTELINVTTLESKKPKRKKPKKRKNQEDEKLKSEIEHLPRQLSNQEITVNDLDQQSPVAEVTPRQDEEPVAVETPRQDEEPVAVETPRQDEEPVAVETPGQDKSITTKENMQKSFNKKEKHEEDEEDEEEDDNELELSITNEPAVAEEIEPQTVSIDKYLAKFPVKPIGSTRRSVNPHPNKEEQMMSLLLNQTNPDYQSQDPGVGTFDIERNEAIKGLERRVLLALHELKARKEKEITDVKNIKITKEITEIKKLIEYVDNNIKIHRESEPIHTSLQEYLRSDNLFQAEKLLNFIKENQEENREPENLVQEYIDVHCSCQFDFTALHFAAMSADLKSYENFKKFIKTNLEIKDEELTSLYHKVWAETGNGGFTPDELYQNTLKNNLQEKFELKSQKLAEIKQYFAIKSKIYKIIKKCFINYEKDKKTRFRHYKIFRTIQEINSENKVFENQQDPTKDYLTSVLNIVTSLNAVFCKGTLNFQNVQRYINPIKGASETKKEISIFKEALNIYLLSKDADNNSILHHAAACVKTPEDYTKYQQLETGLARFLTKPAYGINVYNDLDTAPAAPNTYAKTYNDAKNELNAENITAQKPEDIIFEKLPELKPKTPAPTKRTLATKMGLPPKTPAAAPARRTLATRTPQPTTKKR